MKKSIITIVAFILFALASVSAQAADVLVIHVLFMGRDMKILIYQNGSVTEKKLPMADAGRYAEYTKNLGDLFASYYKEGYRLISSTSHPDSREYLLEKE